MRLVPACAFVFAASLTAASAFADEPTPSPTPAQKPFGSRGMLAIDDLVGVDDRPAPTAGASYFPFVTVMGASTASRDETYANDAGGLSTGRASFTAFWLAPSFDYFVADRLSVGATISVSNAHEHTARGDGADYFNVSALPRLGYALPIARDVTFWPRLQAGYGLSMYGSTKALSFVAVRANAGFVFRLSDHVMLDAGPYAQWVSTEVGEAATSNDTSAAFGARAMFGLVF